MEWELNDPPEHKEEQILVEYLTKELGDHEAAKLAGRMWSLYTFLEVADFEDAEELREHVLSNGKPLFSEKEAKQVFEMIPHQTGGAEDVELLDNMVHRFITFVYNWTPAFITDITDSVTPYVFILKTLEYDTSFGPFIGIALDSANAILPSIATTIQNVTPDIVGLVPIPEAGLVGAIIGWMVASGFIFVAMVLNISREHFGQAFIQSFQLIPFVGTSMYNAAMSGERFLKKTASRRERLIETTRNTLGDDAASVVDTIIPDPLYNPDTTPLSATSTPKPSFSIPSLSDLKSMATSKLGELGVPTSVEQLKQRGMQELSTRGIPTSTDEAKQMAINRATEEAKQRGIPLSLGEANQKVYDKALNVRDQLGIPKSFGESTQRFKNMFSKKKVDEAQQPVQQAGKRLSRRHHTYGKWRTRRFVK